MTSTTRRPTSVDAFGIDRCQVKHLIVSHGHHDHFEPIEILCFAEALPHPLSVYGSTMVCDALAFCRRQAFDSGSKRFVTQSRPFNIELNTMVPGTTAQVGDTRVTAVQSNHLMDKLYCIMEQQALNFVIEAYDQTIYYDLDSSYVIPATLERLSHFRFDIAVMDATFGPLEIDPAQSGHMSWKMLDETIAEFREASCIDDETIIIADHLSPGSVEPYDKIVNVLAARGITLAYDGLKVEL